MKAGIKMAVDKGERGPPYARCELQYLTPFVCRRETREAFARLANLERGVERGGGQD